MSSFINYTVKGTLCISSLSVLFLALCAFFNIEFIMKFVGVSAVSPYAHSEIRTLFGGVLLVFGAVVLVSIFDLFSLSLKFGVNLYLGFVGGVLLGRFYTLIVDGFHTWGSYGMEKQGTIIAEVVTFLLVSLYYLQDKVETKITI